MKVALIVSYYNNHNTHIQNPIILIHHYNHMNHDLLDDYIDYLMRNLYTIKMMLDIAKNHLKKDNLATCAELYFKICSYGLSIQDLI